MMGYPFNSGSAAFNDEVKKDSNDSVFPQSWWVTEGLIVCISSETNSRNPGIKKKNQEIQIQCSLIILLHTVHYRFDS